MKLFSSQTTMYKQISLNMHLFTCLLLYCDKVSNTIIKLIKLLLFLYFTFAGNQT